MNAVRVTCRGFLREAPEKGGATLKKKRKTLRGSGKRARIRAVNIYQKVFLWILCVLYAPGFLAVCIDAFLEAEKVFEREFSPWVVLFLSLEITLVSCGWFVALALGAFQDREED